MSDQKPAVYDCRTADWAPRQRLALRDWLTSQGVDPADVYRVEIHHSDAGPTTRVFAYVPRVDGKRVPDETGEAPATVPPYDVPATSLPPSWIPATRGNDR